MKSYNVKADRIEACLVFGVLALTVALTGHALKDVVSASAVFLSFLCSQIAFTLGEAMPRGNLRKLSKRYRHLYFAKEGCWILTCVLLQSYPLLASTVIFATYPYWRRAIRGEQPQPHTVLEPIIEMSEPEESLTEVDAVGLAYVH